MTEKIKILAFAGSTRKDSLNKKVINNVVPILEEAGAKVTKLELNDIPLPLFDEDLESKGLPENVRKLKDLMIDHNGFFISSPEYNGFFSGVLKNAIDWASRPVDGYPPLECFQNKVAAISTAAPGAMGGIRSINHLRQQLTNLKTLVIPDQQSIPFAAKAFDENGTLSDDKLRQNLKNMSESLIKHIAKLK